MSSQDYELLDTTIDAGISVKSTDRPGLQRVLNLVSKKKTQHVVTLKLQRLSRRKIDALNLLETLTKKNVKLHLVTENGSVNSDNADDEFMLTLKADFAQLERKKIIERTKSALDRKRQLGERISLNAPYGHMFMDGKIVDNPDEQRVIRKIYDFHSQGDSLRSIAKKLACRKIFNRNNEPFAVTSIHRILKKSA